MELEDNGTANSTVNQSGSVVFYPDLKQPVTLVIVYCLGYGIIFLFSLIGNILVIAVIYKYRRMHTIFNLFICNLAVADILMAIFCIPITLLANLFTGWKYGAVMCKAIPYLQGTAVCASVNTLAVIALDRYFVVCQESNRRLSWKVSWVIVFLMWIMSLGIMTPWALFYRTEEFRTELQVIYICRQVWPSEEHEKFFFLGVVFLVCYIAPLVFIVVCYSKLAVKVWRRNVPGMAHTSAVMAQSKFRVAKMLAVLVFMFALSWLPIYVIHIHIYFGTPQSLESLRILHNIIIPISQWLALSNSSINPIIYFFFSNSIRKRSQALLRGFFISRKREQRRQQLASHNSRYLSLTTMNGDSVVCTNPRHLALGQDHFNRTGLVFNGSVNSFES